SLARGAPSSRQSSAGPSWRGGASVAYLFSKPERRYADRISGGLLWWQPAAQICARPRGRIPAYEIQQAARQLTERGDRHESGASAGTVISGDRVKRPAGSAARSR